MDTDFVVSRTYRIECIECGDRFNTVVNSVKTGDELKRVGIDQAAGWGAEMIEMVEIKFDPNAWDTDRSAKEQLDEKIARGELPPLTKKG